MGDQLDSTETLSVVLLVKPAFVN